MKTNLIIKILCIFILTSAAAGAPADNASNGADPLNLSNNLSFSSINLSGELTYFPGHTSDPSEGNWIALGNPSERRRIQLPQPITFTYSGPKSLKRGEFSGNLSSSNGENYTLSYPSTPDYTTLPVYLPVENVTLSFFGDSALKGNVDVYVLNITSKSAKEILGVLSTRDVKNLRSTFNKTIGGNYKNYSAVLGENGDLFNYSLGSYSPGQYCIILIQKNADRSLTVLSTTAFVVEEYDLNVSAPASIVVGSNLDISMVLNGTSRNDSSNFTCGAVLVNEQAYKANIEINSNGTINGTSVLINGENLTEKLDINASNYKSKLTKKELQKEIQNLIGEGNGTITVGEVGQKRLSLTTFDLPQGHYYLFVGVYDPKGKIAGLTQLYVDIASLPFHPVANFSSNVSSGYAPLSVQFIDSSNNATGVRWDFDNNGLIDSTDRNPVYVYQVPGTYTVNLTASNANGTNSKLSIITVQARPGFPVANFNSNVIIGFTPLSVQFNDSSVNATGWHWDFGDGTNSTEANPVHTFTSVGNYIVYLTASNGNGTGIKSTTISVLERPPEPSGNIEKEESSQGFASGGVPESFNFSSGSTPILGISFSTDQTLGNILVAIDLLTGKSSLTSNLPPGFSVFEYLDIWISGATSMVSDNFSNATITFKVTKTWVQEYNINISTIKLNRYHNGVWDALSTTLIGQDDANYLFTAQTPGFSPFAITGEHNQNFPGNLTSYSIFKSVIGVDESGDCIINAPRDVLQYRIVVKNEGKVNLTNVSVTDPRINLTGPIGNGTEERKLQPGEIWEYTGNYSVTADDINNGTIINTASVKSDQLQEINSSVYTPVTKTKKLQIYKSATGIDEAGDRLINKVGDIIQYRVAVKNTGDVDLTNVAVDDPMVNLTKSRGDQNDPGVLNPGENWIYIGNYSVTQTDIDSVDADGNGLITNTATISCDELSSKNSSLELPIVIVKKYTFEKVSPAADFTVNPESGYAPLTVQFTDKSTGSPTSWSWDFDNDGFVDSSNMNPVHKYTTPGTYTARLTVNNANGSSSDTATISVLQATSPGKGGNITVSSDPSGGGDSEGKAVIVRNDVNGPSANTNAAANVTPTANNTSSTQVPSKVVPQNEKGAKTGTGTNSQVVKDEGTAKIASFLIGLLVVLLAGVLIFKKIGPKREK